MMSLCRNLAVLALLASPLFHSHRFSHAASTSTPTTRHRIIFFTGLGSERDYDDYDENYSLPPKVESSVKPPLLQRERKPCAYDSCSETQEPCHRIAERTKCLCPGMSGSDEPPHAPRIRALLPATEGDNTGEIQVQWCAPSSSVSSYKVVVEGREGDALEFGEAVRQGLVGALEVGTKVCVEAVNAAGPSSPSEFSCKRYEHPQSSDNNLLLWVIGGGAALLLLLVILSVILWKYQLCQK